MTKENEKLEQNQREKPMSFMTVVLLTGFFGGILWSSLGYLAKIFKFTEIHPNVILEPWTLGDWKRGWMGTVFAIFLLGVASIIVALIYYGTMRKFKSIFAGMVFGILVFLLVFFVLNPIFPGIPPATELKKNTIFTSVCLFILYGTFIGYSISYEEEEQQVRKQQNQKVESHNN